MKIFPARELKEVAENITQQKLVVGECYYMVEFVDEEMLIPEITPVFFWARVFCQLNQTNLSFKMPARICKKRCRRKTLKPAK